jgi:hypothetical protein
MAPGTHCTAQLSAQPDLLTYSTLFFFRLYKLSHLFIFFYFSFFIHGPLPTLHSFPRFLCMVSRRQSRLFIIWEAIRYGRTTLASYHIIIYVLGNCIIRRLYCYHLVDICLYGSHVSSVACAFSFAMARRLQSTTTTTHTYLLNFELAFHV